MIRGTTSVYCHVTMDSLYRYVLPAFACRIIPSCFNGHFPSHPTNGHQFAGRRQPCNPRAFKVQLGDVFTISNYAPLTKRQLSVQSPESYSFPSSPFTVCIFIMWLFYFCFVVKSIG